MKITPVLLAAGQGTRMKSALPKVLHPICGRPMIEYALQAVQPASSETPVIVVGHGAEVVQNEIGERGHFVLQAQQLGTGHAVLQAEESLRGQTDLVIVTYADMPLLRPETISQLVEMQQNNTGPISMVTVRAENPRGFGRVIRSADGTVAAIVEEAQASAEELQIKELNVGAYCFSSAWLWDALHRIPVSPKGEYYLTDAIALAVQDSLPVQALLIENMVDAIGVNTRIHLAEAEGEMRKRINQKHMLQGVTIIDPGHTYIEADVTIDSDTVIWPNTYLKGNTSIGSGCELGPNTMIRDTQVGDGCTILASVLEGAHLENRVEIGPFARLRKGAYLCDDVHMGNFGEIKNSTLHQGVKMGHFSYIGDADIGSETNIGAGTITCNYDGKRKHKTEIGKDVHIGSDTMLVAPLKIGDRAQTGAGAVVTKDVSPDTLVVGMPARAIKKLEKRDND